MINKRKLILKIRESFHWKRINLSQHTKCQHINIAYKPPWKILFFGTDKFSLFSLGRLLQEYRNGGAISRLEVCTSIKEMKNDVYKFAKKENLRIWKWPPELNRMEFDAGLVVSFGHLIPKQLIENFPLGMINVHASLLPRWRGAAPIIYSLANGDKITGVTIMQIEPARFDVGKIISQKSIKIPDNIYLPELNVKLGSLGANELIECLKDLPKKLNNAEHQSKEGISYAPKVETSFARIDWENMTSSKIFNLERALKGFLPLTSIWKGEIIKLFGIGLLNDGCDIEMKQGFIHYDDESQKLKVVCTDKNYITIEKVQIYQRKLMAAKDFNNGYLKKVPLEERYFL
ncbi:methionyl-tRNA formyltransferase, mitochondrial [Harmonia axyridis]|uniref:methionyl-tRNA formyltransferase, mitochondrial n=1 Tax=Harmonia axyridis TaxID=115357 RepID=UPI001E277DE6|nr:methionyl-tRNA formyltransferase, mitochondrial [Harmonia axyridis]XP_045465922.1 methionyl-tRNA formyltransferase, mitochondrial [Harmonia axyridis]